MRRKRKSSQEMNEISDAEIAAAMTMLSHMLMHSFSSSALEISLFFFSSRRRHTRFSRDWSSDVCSSDLTNETVFDELNAKPETLIVLGGGPIGCELAQTFRRLGVGVTIIQRRNQLLPKEDPDVACFLESRLIGEGVRVIKNADVHSVATGDAGKIALELLDRQSDRLAELIFFADALLVATGRTPNFRSLDLKPAGVEVSEKGIRVNEYLQTSQPHIYAVGDVIGPFLFTHMADAQARVVVRNILVPFQFLRQKMDYSVVPWCTYVYP